MKQRRTRRGLRLILAGGVGALAFAALTSVGAAVSPSGTPAATDQYPKKVTICHRTHSKKHPWVKIRVSTHALKAHLRHGDFVVDANHPCPPTSATAKAKKNKHGKHGKNATHKSKHKSKHNASAQKKKHGQAAAKNNGNAGKKGNNGNNGNNGNGNKGGKK